MLMSFELTLMPLPPSFADIELLSLGEEEATWCMHMSMTTSSQSSGSHVLVGRQMMMRHRAMHVSICIAVDATLIMRDW